MARAASEPERSPAAGDDRMPRGVWFAVLAVLGAIVGGALLLTAIRGPAILIDLAGGVKAFFCM